MLSAFLYVRTLTVWYHFVEGCRENQITYALTDCGCDDCECRWYDTETYIRLAELTDGLIESSMVYSNYKVGGG